MNGKETEVEKQQRSRCCPPPSAFFYVCLLDRFAIDLLHVFKFEDLNSIVILLCR
eukprot:m.144621 g.144621  ORF g.144621 m.144621 type:complete len:55 (+) comp16047_c0_seq1:230-394(+)